MSLNKETVAYKNKLKYIAEYNKTKNTKISISLSKEYDKDIIDRLDEVSGKATYIKKLIRFDIKNQKA